MTKKSRHPREGGGPGHVFCVLRFRKRERAWIPAFAGMTEEKNGMTAFFVIPA